ncbi:ABC transporter ATP-binding protein [Paenibacillus sp. strain BS8-2]
MRMLRNITGGNPRMLIKPVMYTSFANLAGILPFALLVLAAQFIFEPFLHPGTPLNTAGLWWVCGGMGASLLLSFALERLAFRAQYRSAFEAAASGRARLAEHLRRLPLGFLNKRDPGDLASMMMGDFTLVEHGISHLVPQMFGALVMPLIALAGLAWLDWRMALALFVAFPIGVLLLMLTSGIQRKLGADHMRAKLNAVNRLQEYLNGIRVIKSYHLTGEKFSRLEGSFKELMKHSIRIEGRLGPIVISAIAIIRAGLTVMIMVGVQLLLGGTLDLLVLLTFLLIGTRIFDPLTSALVNYANFKYNEQAGERIVALMEQPIMPGDKQPPNAHDIVFKDVSFGYQSKEVLKKINVRMPVGSFTALVGPSGSGKTTILRLITRFYDPDQGRVLLGGEDVKEMDPDALLQKVSMVFQDVYLFQDTIANNIRIGRSGATQQEIEEAAKQACCHDFIMKLPNGYETLVGEGGSTLSGGEKQRISIAQAILKDAPIVLLDEATASLDPENEQQIQQAISRLVNGRTVIAIAHRLKTIKNATNIIVLDKNTVEEQGQHDELLASDKVYARLWRLQQQAEGWKISSLYKAVDH